MPSSHFGNVRATAQTFNIGQGRRAHSVRGAVQAVRCWALGLRAAARAHRAPGVDDDVLATARLRVWHSPATLAKLDAVEPSAPCCAPDADAVSPALREAAATKA